MELNAYQAAEQMESAFSKREFASVSHILGSDWASGLDFKGDAQAYQNAAYDRADAKFGVLPWRYQSEE